MVRLLQTLEALLPPSLDVMDRLFVRSSGHQPTNQDIIVFMYSCPDFFGATAPRPGLYVSVTLSGLELRTHHYTLPDLVGAKVEDARLSLRRHAEEETSLLARDGLLVPVWFELREDAMSGLPPATP